MAKLVSPRREENLIGKAREYIRTHIVFPSALLGLILLLAATMGLGYQYLADTYAWSTFLQSTGLAVGGALAGWGQSRYHRYLLRHTPEFLAGRMEAFSGHRRGKHRQDRMRMEPRHRGRAWVPLWYVLAALTLLGLSFWAAAWGSVYAVAAYLLPWAGFFCARVYAWKDLWSSGPTRPGKS